MESILVHYGELALKGAKREFFEQQLIENIAHSLEIKNEYIKQYKGQMVVEIGPERVDDAIDALKRVMGITWVIPTERCENDLQVIRERAVKVARPLLARDKSFAVRGHRSIKTLPFDSQDIQREVGGAIIDATNAKVDLGEPDINVYVTASQEGTYIYTSKHKGPGGLPVGTSGKALVLLSGGFDSIAAAYLLAKRGALVDFIHFHVYPSQEPVLDSKIFDIAHKLSSYSLSNALYLSSYIPFEFSVMDLNWSLRRFETVAFRRLMVRVAADVAHRDGYQALVMGDCLGQVASQTMENISAVENVAQIPIFRPLIGFDKVEIIRLVREMGVYDLAVADYKDCCSLLAPEPSVKADLSYIERLERKIGIERIVEEMVSAVEKVSIAGS